MSDFSDWWLINANKMPPVIDVIAERTWNAAIKHMESKVTSTNTQSAKSQCEKGCRYNGQCTAQNGGFYPEECSDFAHL